VTKRLRRRTLAKTNAWTDARLRRQTLAKTRAREDTRLGRQTPAGANAWQDKSLREQALGKTRAWEDKSLREQMPARIHACENRCLREYMLARIHAEASLLSLGGPLWIGSEFAGLPAHRGQWRKATKQVHVECGSSCQACGDKRSAGVLAGGLRASPPAACCLKRALPGGMPDPAQLPFERQSDRPAMTESNRVADCLAVVLTAKWTHTMPTEQSRLDVLKGR